MSQPSFASLRLTDSDFAVYQEQDRDKLWKIRPIGSTGVPLRIKGYDQDVRNAIQQSNSDGAEYFIIPWGMIDSILWITKRIEDRLKIPCRHWSLAANGSLLQPGQLVNGLPIFSKPTGREIELFIVTPNNIREYLNAEKETTPHLWKYLSPSPATAETTPLERARAKFHLLSPEETGDWPTYIEDREKAEALFDKQLKRRGELTSFLEHVKTALETVLMTTETEEQHWQSVADGVVVLRSKVDEGSMDDVSNASVLTRIYSAHCAKAVDVFFEYHHRTRMNSVDWDYRILIRPNAPLSSQGPEYRPPSSNKRSLLSAGWISLAHGGFVDPPPGQEWYHIERKSFDITFGHIKNIRNTLFGEEQPLESGTYMDALRFVLASVGISYRVQEMEGADDELDEQEGSIQWELGGDWFAVKMREACGMKLERDKMFRDRSEML